MRLYLLFFFFNDTATTEIYTLSLHDALPISEEVRRLRLHRIDPGKLRRNPLRQQTASGVAVDLEPARAIDRQRGRRSKPHVSALERNEDLLVEPDGQPVRRHLDCDRDARLALERVEPSRDVDEDEPVALAEEVSQQVERVDKLVDAGRERPERLRVGRELGWRLLGGERRRLLA